MYNRSEYAVARLPSGSKAGFDARNEWPGKTRRDRGMPIRMCYAREPSFDAVCRSWHIVEFRNRFEDYPPMWLPPPKLGRRFVVLALHAVFAGCAAPPDKPAWPDSFVSRLSAQALIQQLNAELLASRTATATLEAWCGSHRLADPPRVFVHRVKSGDVAPTPEQRERLRIEPDTEVKYRRVQLRCGDRVLSEAENWYVPGRLDPDMNGLLETTDIPFGKVVKPLDPSRRTFASKMLWSPLPAGWELEPQTTDRNAEQPLVFPAGLFEHRALLYDRAYRPLAELHEVYRRDLLDFPLMPSED